MTSPPSTLPPAGVAPAHETQRKRDLGATGLPGPGARLMLMAGLALVAVVSTMRPETAALSAPEPSAPQPVIVETTAEAQAPVAVAPSEMLLDEEPVEEAPEASDAPLPEGVIYQDSFDVATGDWLVMTGTWQAGDGSLRQTDPSGFDYINQLTVEMPAAYDITVTMQADGPELGGGVILGQPDPGSRRGAHIVDFTAGGSFLRWGRYDPQDGVYSYLGGLDLGVDPATPHELRVDVRADTTLVHLDGTYIGAFEAVGTGWVGLVTSQSAVNFSDLVIEAS
ncbi:MAG: hypothetical protein AAF480_04220 [Actinomycetota bacterium]